MDYLMATKFRRFQPQSVSPEPDDNDDNRNFIQIDGSELRYLSLNIPLTDKPPTQSLGKTKILPKVRETKFTRKKS